MKSKDLIALLKKADPSGETECVVGNADLIGVYVEKAATGGWYQVLVRNRNGVRRVRMVGTGLKLVIEPHPLAYCLTDNPRLPVDVDGHDKDGKVRRQVEALRVRCQEEALKET